MPVAMPTWSFLRISSGRILGAPRNLDTLCGVMRMVPVWPSATRRATLRQMDAISRSKLRRPDSRV